MILVDGEKYACVQCIRGHRSSTCKHTTRPLVQVRSRGRPSLNAGHRIAVTKSEVVLRRDEAIFQKDLESDTRAAEKSSSPSSTSTSKSKSCCGSKPVKKTSCCGKKAEKSSCNHHESRCCDNAGTEKCGCNNDGIILLKASKREFVNVKNGNLDYVGPYSGQKLNNFKLGAYGIRKPKLIQSAGCSSTASNIDDLRVLKTLKVNEVDHKTHQYMPILPRNDALDSLSDTDLSIHHPPQQQEYIQTNNTTHYLLPRDMNQFASFPTMQAASLPINTGSLSNERIFDMIMADGCAETCHCGPECSCPGCFIHRTDQELRDFGILEDGSSTNPSTPSEIQQDFSDSGNINNSYNNNINNGNIDGSYETARAPTPMEMLNFETIDEMNIQELLDDECSCDADKCCCYNCSRHGIVQGIRLRDGVKVSSFDSNNGDQVESPVAVHDCGCAPEECDCYNCPTHGIYNGVRIGAHI